MSRRFVLLVAILFIAIPSYSGMHFEINGAYSTVVMSPYNDYVSELEFIAEYYNYDYEIELIRSTTAWDVAAVIKSESKSVGVWGFYLKFGYLPLQSDNNKLFWPGGEVFIKTEGEYSTYSVGGGIRKYIEEFYIGADVNQYFNSKGQLSDSYFWDDGDLLWKDAKEWNFSMTGFNIESGINVWFGKNAGINVKGGYRYLKGTVQYTWDSLFYEGGGTEDVDLSGYFIGGGIMFRMDDNQKKKKASVDVW